MVVARLELGLLNLLLCPLTLYIFSYSSFGDLKVLEGENSMLCLFMKCSEDNQLNPFDLECCLKLLSPC